MLQSISSLKSAVIALSKHHEAMLQDSDDTYEKVADEEAPASKPAGSAPPWRSRQAGAGGDDDRKPPSRDDWKSRGRDGEGGGDGGAGAAARPWNRNKPSGGGGADGGSWR